MGTGRGSTMGGFQGAGVNPRGAGGPTPPTPVGERPIPGRSPFDTVNDNPPAPTFGGGLPYAGGAGGGMTPLPPTPAPSGGGTGADPGVGNAIPPGMGGIGGYGVDAGYGTGPLVNGFQKEAGLEQPQVSMPFTPAPQPPVQPTMPAGMPPPQMQPPARQAPTAQQKMTPEQRYGGAPVSAKPASVGMSSAADAQAAMMKRAGVRPPMPVSKVPPKPGA